MVNTGNNIYTSIDHLVSIDQDSLNQFKLIQTRGGFDHWAQDTERDVSPVF